MYATPTPSTGLHRRYGQAAAEAGCELGKSLKYWQHSLEVKHRSRSVKASKSM